jgi:hypothetical protein
MKTYRKAVLSDETVLMKSIPPQVYDHATEVIKRYSVCLVGINPATFGMWGRPLGSATIVSSGHRLGLLTAAHVTASDAFEDSIRIGLSIQEATHQYSIDRTYLTISSIGKDFESGNGPDLSVIVIPDAEHGRVLAAMSAWNIDQEIDSLFDPHIPDECFVWCPSGFPQYLQTREPPSDVAGPQQRLGGFIGMTDLAKREMREAREYLELTVQYEEPPGSTLPKTFKGMSGGGLWKFPLAKGRKTGEFIPIDPALVGIVFWEAIREKVVIFLRCHGVDAVYKEARKLIANA